MPELTAKDIADWHRSQAKKHEGIAKRHNDMAASVEQGFDAPVPNWQRLSSVPPPRPRVNPVNAAELESAVRNSLKEGRVSKFAAKLNTDTNTIYALLNQPDCKVYIAERGWLKVRE